MEAWLRPPEIVGGGVGDGKLAAESGGGGDGKLAAESGGGGVMEFTWICSRLCWNLQI